jgi:hypothetical protein
MRLLACLVVTGLLEVGAVPRAVAADPLGPEFEALVGIDSVRPLGCAAAVQVGLDVAGQQKLQYILVVAQLDDLEFGLVRRVLVWGDIVDIVDFVSAGGLAQSTERIGRLAAAVVVEDVIALVRGRFALNCLEFYK